LDLRLQTRHKQYQGVSPYTVEGRKKRMLET
jgi:hypothetical protein